jgi:hypothetical protein
MELKYFNQLLDDTTQREIIRREHALAADWAEFWRFETLDGTEQPRDPCASPVASGPVPEGGPNEEHP